MPDKATKAQKKKKKDKKLKTKEKKIKRNKEPKHIHIDESPPTVDEIIVDVHPNAALV